MPLKNRIQYALTHLPRGPPSTKYGNHIRFLEWRFTVEARSLRTVHRCCVADKLYPAFKVFCSQYLSKSCLGEATSSQIKSHLLYAFGRDSIKKRAKHTNRTNALVFSPQVHRGVPKLGWRGKIVQRPDGGRLPVVTGLPAHAVRPRGSVFGRKVRFKRSWWRIR